MRSIVFLVALFSLAPISAAEVRGIRVWPSAENARVIVELSGAVEYHAYLLENPYQLVVDVRNAKANGVQVPTVSENPFIRGVRFGMTNATDLRLVLDLPRALGVRDGLIPPFEKYGHRLVIELHEQPTPKASPHPEKSPSSPVNSSQPSVQIVRKDGQTVTVQLPLPTAHGSRGSPPERPQISPVVAVAPVERVVPIGAPLEHVEALSHAEPPGRVDPAVDADHKHVAHPVLPMGQVYPAVQVTPLERTKSAIHTVPQRKGLGNDPVPVDPRSGEGAATPPPVAHAFPASLGPRIAAVEPAGGGRAIVVAVDAGHGGEDPGAIGPDGTYEKDVVLAIARELAAQINAEPGMRAVLTRRGDHFVSLRSRMEKARRQRADLFVSVHADAVADRAVAGSSVYVLSSKGASSEAARWLAETENASDHLGGVEIDNKDDVLKSVLLDLSQSAVMGASVELAGDVLRHLHSISKVHRPTVQHAGFAVLKSPDIPSILVETAYISNRQEEDRLRSREFHRQIAHSILSGIGSYFRRNAPVGTYFAHKSQDRGARQAAETPGEGGNRNRTPERQAHAVPAVAVPSARGQVLRAGYRR
jgi:N-acetylmuramoyl-L-alanine amidase